MFTGERREVTVMFIDIRDHLRRSPHRRGHPSPASNALFGDRGACRRVEAGGRVNQFLGDALAVFGAPNDLDRTPP